jgi:hypothetical protein
MGSNVIAASEKEETSPESASSAWRQNAIRLCIRNQLRPVMVRVRVFRFDIEDNRSLQINEVIVRIGEGRCGQAPVPPRPLAS